MSSIIERENNNKVNFILRVVNYSVTMVFVLHKKAVFSTEGFLVDL